MLEEVCKYIDDMVDEWNFAALKRRIEGRSEDLSLPWASKKVCPLIPSSSSFMCFKKVVIRRDMVKNITELRERLDVIAVKKDLYGLRPLVRSGDRGTVRLPSTSLVHEKMVYGRDTDKKILVRKLMLEVVQVGPQVISIVGATGIGKTTLAELVYNDNLLKNYFDVRVSVWVSDDFSPATIANSIVQTEYEAIRFQGIEGKKFLLFLDDVWTEDYSKWEPLKESLNCGDPGSKILVTTRNERVARMMGSDEIHYLGRLSDEDCWMLMKDIAFCGQHEEAHQEFEVISREIAKNCNGLPLAAKFLGSLLRTKRTKQEWESILQSVIWEVHVSEAGLFPLLFLSYKDLSPVIKQCFLYCGVFPQKSEIVVEKLIRMWMALGYLSQTERMSDLESRGIEYFENLIMYSVFKDFVVHGDRVYCKIDETMHDFAQFLKRTKSQDHNHGVNAKKKLSLQDYSQPLVSQAQVYRSLICQNELPSERFYVITCLRVLSLCECDMQEIPSSIEALIHLRYLDLSGNGSITGVSESVCKLYYLQTLYLSNCWLRQIPRKIGNLIYLRHLDFSWNSYIEELPEPICNLYDLRTLNIAYCSRLSRLPRGIEKLSRLRHLPNDETEILHQIPQGLEKLTGLQTLRLFHAGKDWSKLGYLERLDQLSESLELKIRLHDREDVNEARKAALRRKINIQRLKIYFLDAMRRTEGEVSISNETMEALQPSPNLHYLTIHGYKGTKFPAWISSSLSHLKVLEFQGFSNITTLPCLGKLPELKELSVWVMEDLRSVGREFLGIEGNTDGSTPSSGVVISFPNLESLSLRGCPNWEEWEDITAEEEKMGSLLIMPHLKQLAIHACRLTQLPHRLLRKASSLQHLTIERSFNLLEHYGKNGSGSRFLSHIPHVTVS
ncbi:UNVERIFIED_CONTAM: putative disease resistance protein RGA1 [Sesamum indicum]